MLGKELSQNKDTRLLQIQMLFDFSMGFYTPSGMDMFSPTGYYPIESEFVHPLSLENTARRYAYNKLETFIPIDKYMEWPASFIEPMLTGFVRGRTERDALDKENEPKEPSDADVAAALEREFKKAKR